MYSLEQLSAIEEIKQVKARYWRTMDRRLWDDYENVFTENCVCDISLAGIVPEIGKLPTPEDPGFEKDYILHGRRAYRQFVENLLNGTRSVHQGHIPEIKIISECTAEAIFPFEDMLDFPEGTSPRHIHGYGHYEETYRKVNGQWLIDKMTIYRLRVTTSDSHVL